MKRLITNIVNTVFILALLAGLLPAQVVFAERMTSSSYTLESDSVNFAGGRSTSSSYIGESTAGEVGTGNLTGASTNASIGFQQAEAEASSSASPSPEVGGNTGGSSRPFQTFFPVNVEMFTAFAGEKSILLSWLYPEGADISSVRIVRSDKFYPITIDDGEVVFEGDALQAIDYDVVPGVTYYYALFAKNSRNQFSSGVLAQARIVVPGTEPVSTDPFAGIPQAENVHPAISALTLLDFDFIQDGRKIEQTKKGVVIDAKKDLTIQLAYNKVPEILKTIAISLADPNDPTLVFTFLLRANDDRTVYEATIAPLSRGGMYTLNAIILDYENQGLKRLSGQLRALALDSAEGLLYQISKNSGILIAMILLLVLAFILIVLLVRNRRNTNQLGVAGGTASLLAFILYIVVSAYPVYAAINKEINYQGKISTSAGAAVADGTYEMEFKLYTQASGGTAIWTETLSGANEVQITDGLFSVLLGQVTSLSGVDFNQTLYLGVNIENDGEMSPRKKLGAVPAAFVADTLDGIDSTTFLRIDSGSISSGYFTATSTTASTFPYASTTALSATTICLTTDCRTAWPSGGSAGGSWSTTTSQVAGRNVNYSNSNTDIITIGGTATTSAPFWFDPNTLTSVLTGSVGIGTTSPGTALSISGVANFASTGSTLYSRLFAPSFVATSTTASVFPYASSTALTSTSIFGTNLTLGTLNGPLHANNGVVAATSSIGVLYGGTGLTTAPSYGNILVGDNSGGYTLTATSSLGLVSLSDVNSYIAASTTIPKTYVGNTFTNSNTFTGSTTVNTLLATGSTTLQNFTAVNSTTTNATSTTFFATTASSSDLYATNARVGTFTLGSVTGFLKATAGAVATAAIDLAADITGILGVSNGGTGWSNIQSNTILLGNGSGQVSTTTAGTNGQVLALVAGVPTWVATTTFGSGLTYLNGNVTLDATGSWTGTFDGFEGSYYLANSFSTSSADFYVNGSTTIPKTYTANTWTGLNTFNGGVTIGTLNGPLHANNGVVAATTSIGVVYGGTGLTSYTTGDLIYASAGTTLAKLGIGGNGTCLTSNGSTPAWGSCAAGGGSGGGSWSTTTSQVAGRDVNYSNNSSDIIAIGGTSTTSAKYWFDPNVEIASLAGSVTVGSLTIGSVNGALQAVNGAVSATSTLSVAYGGTGLSTIPTYGQVLVGNSSGGYTLMATSSLGITGTPSQWTTTGNDIYYSTGAVGIGTSSPFASLAVNPIAGQASNQFVVGSSTGTSFLINNTGNVGIGTTSPSARFNNASTTLLAGHTAIGRQASIDTPLSGLHTNTVLSVKEILTYFPTYALGINNDISLSSGANTSTFSVANINTIRALGSVNYTGGTISLAGYAQHEGTGTVAALRGVQATATNQGGGITTAAYGLSSSVTNASGTTGSAYGLHTAAVVVAGSIPNNYGLYVARPSVVTGSITNNTALYIENQAGAASNLNYNIYSVGTTSLNYFGGLVGIGTTTPGQRLSVEGDILGHNIIGSRFHATSTTASVFPYASSTALTSTSIFGTNLTLGTLNGPLHANNGVVAATSSIGVLYGGTGLTTAPSYGNILVGNSSGGYTLTATSSLGLATFAFPFTTATNYNITTNSTTSPMWFRDQIFASSSAIIAGDVTASNFIATSTTATSTFANHISIGAGKEFRVDGTGILTRNSNASVLLGRLDGNSRGSNALDLQTLRNAVTQVAAGADSAAVGTYNRAGGADSMAFGTRNTIGIAEGLAFGASNTVTGSTFSSAFGYNNIASSTASLAFGASNQVGENSSGSWASAFGLGNWVDGTEAQGFGANNTVNGNASGAYGYFNEISAAGAYVYGANITNNTAGSVQFGTSEAGKMTLLSNGYLGIGSTTPGAQLGVRGNVLANAFIGSYFHSTSTTASVFPYASTTALSATTICLTTDCRTAWPIAISPDWQKETNYGALALTPTTTIPVWFKDQLFASSSAIVAGSVTANNFVATGTASSVFTYASTTALSSGNAWFTGNVGISSTTPWANLAVNPVAGLAANQFAIGSSTGTSFLVNNSGHVGIGTTSPGSILSVQGVANFNTATSTIVATGGGLNITNGCFSVRGVCVVSGEGASGIVNQGTAGQFAAYLTTGNAVSETNLLYFSGSNIGIGTANPYSRFSVVGTGTGSGQLFSLVNSASSTLFQALDNGNIGIGTTSPYAKLSVVGDVVASYFHATNTSATSTFAGGLNVGNGSLVYDFSSGQTSIDDLAIGSLNFETNAGFVSWIDMPVTSAATIGTVQGYSAYIDNNPLLTLFSESDGAGSVRSLGVSVGSSTPYAKLSVWGGGTGTGTAFEIANSASTTLVSVKDNGTAYIMNTLGIGSTTPGAQLGVRGNVLANAFIGSYFHATSTTASVFPYASSTALTSTSIFGTNLTLGTLNGPLHANNGVVAATSSIGVLYGGTGLTTAPSYGNILVGNSSGGYTLTATSSLGLLESQWTTTGSDIYYNTGNVGIGTTSPGQKLSVGGSVLGHDFIGSYFTATSTTATSTFPNIAITNNLKMGEVLLIDSSGNEKIFVATTSSDTGRGTALIMAYAAMTASSTIKLGPGTFDIGSSSMVLANSVSLIGSGMDVTVIKSQAVLGTGGPIIVPGTNSITAHLTIHGTLAAAAGSVNYQAVYGTYYRSSGLQLPLPTNAVAVSIKGIADTDGLYFRNESSGATISTIRVYDSIFQTKYDGIAAFGDTSTPDLYECYNCTILVNGPSGAGFGSSGYATRAGAGAGIAATMRFYGGLISVSNGAQTNYGIEVNNSGSAIVELFGTRLVTTGAGSRDIYIATKGTVKISGVAYDTDKAEVTGTGSLVYLDANPFAKGLANATINVGVGTTSPWARLSVAGWTATGTTTPLFAVGTSTGSGATSTPFIVAASGNVGLSTTSPYARFAVNGSAVVTGNILSSFFTATSTVASVFPYASSTALTSTSIFGTNLTLGTLNGPLHANNGVVAATSSIGVLYGGTGLTTAPSYGNILVGNSSGGYTLTATSSLGLATFAFPFTTATNYNITTNSTTSPMWFRDQIFASSSAIIAGSVTANNFIATGTASSVFPYASTTALSSGNGWFTGSIGVGTTTPSQRISSVDNISWGANNEGLLTWAAGSASVRATQGRDLRLQSNNGNSEITLKSGGNVGIGTTTPETKLHVEGTGTNTTLGQLDTNLRLGTNTVTADAGNEISFRGINSASPDVATYAAISAPVISNGPSGAQGYLSFSTKASAAATSLTEHLRLNHSGYLGLGSTTDLLAKFNVFGTNSTTGSGLIVNEAVSTGCPIGSGSTGYFGYLCANTGGNSNLGFRIHMGETLAGRRALDISNSTGIFASFDGNGRFGVGSTTPNAKTTIQSDGTTTGLGLDVTNSNGTSIFRVIDSGAVAINTEVCSGVAACIGRRGGGGQLDISVNNTITTTLGSDVDFYVVPNSGRSGGFTFNPQRSGGTGNFIGMVLSNAGSFGVGSTTPYGTVGFSNRLPSNEVLVLDALSGTTKNIFDVKLASSTVFSINSTGLATMGYASSTALSATTLCLSTDCRTSWPAVGGGAFPFTTETNYGLTVNSTTSPLWFKDQIFASSSAVIAGNVRASSFTATTTTATSTIAGSLLLGATAPITASARIEINAAALSRGVYLYGNSGAGVSNLLEITNDSTSPTSAGVYSQAPIGVFTQATVASGIGAQIAGPGLSESGYAIYSEAGKNYFEGNTGIGSSTPWANLAVNPVAGLAANQFVVGSSTATNFIINNTGWVGIGTSTPGSLFGIQGVANFTTATSTFVSSDGGINLASGCFAVRGVCVSGGGAPGGSGTVSSGTTGQFAYYASDGTTVSGSSLLVVSSSNIGIATSTPGGKLSVGGTILGHNIVGSYFTATSTTATSTFAGGVEFGSGAGDSIFQFGNDPVAWTLSYLASDNSFRIASSTDGVTNTLFSLTKEANAGIGTTTPWRKLSVTGTFGLSGSLTGASTGNYLCINNTTYEVTTGTTCSASSERFKENVNTLEYGLDTVTALRPVSFTYKPSADPDPRLRLGFMAEEVRELIPELVNLDKDGLPESVDYAKMAPVLVKAIQELNLKVEAFATSTTTVTATSTAELLENSDSFIENIAAKVTEMLKATGGWVADKLSAKYAIFDEVQATKISASSITATSSLTVGTTQKPVGITIYDKVTNQPFCLQMMNGTLMPYSGVCGWENIPEDPTPSPTPEATPTPEVTPSPSPEASPTPTPTPEQTPTPEASPTPEATPTPEVTPSPSPEASPTPEASPLPEASPTPSPEPEQTPAPAAPEAPAETEQTETPIEPTT